MGVVCCLHGGAWLERLGLVDVTVWGREPFDAVHDVELTVSDLEVATLHPLGYGDPRAVERWRVERGVVWTLLPAEDPASPTAAAMTWCRARR